MPKISELPVSSAIAGDEQVVILQGSTKTTTVDEIASHSNQVVVHSAPATLVAGRINELHSADTFTLPLANSVADRVSIVIELPHTYSTLTPTVQTAGADVISANATTDTAILFNSGSVKIRLTSNGVDTWRL